MLYCLWVYFMTPITVSLDADFTHPSWHMVHLIANNSTPPPLKKGFLQCLNHFPCISTWHISHKCGHCDFKGHGNFAYYASTAEIHGNEDSVKTCRITLRQPPTAFQINMIFHFSNACVSVWQSKCRGTLPGIIICQLHRDLQPYEGAKGSNAGT